MSLILPDRPDTAIVHFTDGTACGVAGLSAALRGRHLDQIASVELYPQGGGQLDGRRGALQVRGLHLEIPDLPFPVSVILPLDIAQAVGKGLAQAAVVLP